MGYHYRTSAHIVHIVACNLSIQSSSLCKATCPALHLLTDAIPLARELSTESCVVVYDKSGALGVKKRAAAFPLYLLTGIHGKVSILKRARLIAYGIWRWLQICFLAPLCSMNRASAVIGDY